MYPVQKENTLNTNIHLRTLALLSYNTANLLLKV